MKRILIGSFHHESNSFNPNLSDETDFTVHVKDEIFNHIRDNDMISGIITNLKDEGYTCVPTVFMRGVPNGEVKKDFFLKYFNQMVSIARENKNQIDGITFSLHGSMRIEELGEAEGLILETLRRLFPDIPLFVGLDMHASISQKMIDNCDGFVGYKTAPHVDCTETGNHVVKLLNYALKTQEEINHSVVKIPLLIAGEKSGTDNYPMTKLISKLRKLEENKEVLAASLLMGFPWSDNMDNTLSISLVSTYPIEKTHHLAQELANEVWEHRHDFKFVSEAYPPQEALDKALDYTKEKKYPVYISDSGDNPTAGSSASNTEFLNLILDNCHIDILDNTLIYAGFRDAKAVKACKNKENQYIELTFGNPSATQIVYVKKYIEDYHFRGIPSGDIVLVSIVNTDIILVEKHIGFTETRMFTELGLNPTNHPIIICKLGYLTPDHQKIARASLFALTKGHTIQDLETIDYNHVIRPVYPLDKDM